MINRKKITLWTILLVMFLGLIAFRLFDFSISKTEETENFIPENKVVKNSILVLSDGSINAQDTPLMEDTLKVLFENDGYQYEEIVTNQGTLSDNSIFSTILTYRSAYETYEYIIISGGIIDLMIGTELGEPGATDGSVAGMLTQFFDTAEQQSPYTKYLLVGIPYYQGYNDVETKYTIADYNALLKIIANKYDNVYVMNFVDKTLEDNILPVRNDLIYDKKSVKILYDSLNEIIN